MVGRLGGGKELGGRGGSGCGFWVVLGDSRGLGRLAVVVAL
jgi:hypothetical protein